MLIMAYRGNQRVRKALKDLNLDHKDGIADTLERPTPSQLSHLIAQASMTSMARTASQRRGTGGVANPLHAQNALMEEMENGGAPQDREYIEDTYAPAPAYTK